MIKCNRLKPLICLIETCWNMKQIETIFKGNKKFTLLMFLCFIYGGFALILFFYQIYSSFWRAEVQPFNFFEGRTRDVNVGGLDVNRLRRAETPWLLIIAPNSLSLLFGGIIAIMAGWGMWKLIRDKEVKHITQHITTKLLLPDEQLIIKVLKESNDELTQAKIVKDTGLSKVQAHRAIKRLEARGAIEKHEYGLTNKIILKKEFLE